MEDATATLLRHPAPTRTVEGPTEREDDREISLELVTERMLLGALRERDAAVAAEAARERAEFLAEVGLRFGASLDQEVTYATIAGLALPGLHGWCVVDIVEADGGLRRLAVLHPDASKRIEAQELADRWIPASDERIGVPAILHERRPLIVTERADVVIAAAARKLDTLRVVRALGAGALLIVPIVAHNVVLGAITFVGDPGVNDYSADDVQLAEALASRCAQALEAARLHAAARLACTQADAALAIAETARAEADAARLDAEAARADADIARHEADRANETKTLFLRTMSHELRTPLNAISGYAQILEMGIHGPVTPQQHVALASIQRSQAHLLDLINAVLHYAKLESGHVEYDLRDVVVSDVLGWAKSLVAPQARSKNLTLVMGDRPLGHVVRADAQRLRQILINLLTNAVKFTARHGRIDVSSTTDAGVVRIHVRDTGIGVPSELVEAIFAPFVQVHADLTRPEEGTGLGLAISRDMARAMGGDLTVESILHKGSTFTLTLPAA
jgi:signal transduction histidine kinase